MRKNRFCECWNSPDRGVGRYNISPMSGLPGNVTAALRSFLAEDLGRGDVTSAATIPADARGRGDFLAKSELVASGLDMAAAVFRLLDPGISWTDKKANGDRVAPGDLLAGISGSARALLAGERVALNLLQRMSGIATLTRKFVDAVAGTSCRILDTRKTAPGLRMFDKMAVLAGGGHNHRLGLDDGILIKDNHIRMAGGAAQAVATARQRAGVLFRIEVEVETEDQLREALGAGADVILLDNRTAREIAKLVRIVREEKPGVLLEASGGITLENVRHYAEGGVDFVSVGALTHSVKAADISLNLDIA